MVFFVKVSGLKFRRYLYRHPAFIRGLLSFLKLAFIHCCFSSRAAFNATNTVCSYSIFAFCIWFLEFVPHKAVCAKFWFFLSSKPNAKDIIYVHLHYEASGDQHIKSFSSEFNISLPIELIFLILRQKYSEMNLIYNNKFWCRLNNIW